VIFQPHLYTRTRDFAEGFSEVLDMADELILLPIYPARELPIECVTSEMLLSNMKGADRKIMSKEQVLPYFENKWATGIGSFKHLVITAGAGDIDTLVQPLGELLKKMNA
jgi:UDP-N-acetylmuramate--alanine ligase